MTAAPDIVRLTRTLSALFASAGGYSGYCFRLVKPQHGTRSDTFSGAGSRFASGRFHVKGQFVIVYTGTSLETAQWEYFHTARSVGIDPAFLLPCTAVSAAVTLSKVLDLTDARVRRALQVTLRELRSAGWSGSSAETGPQLLGRLAHAAGFEALLVPSAGGGQNLNILRQNLRPGSAVDILNAGELPA